VRRAPLLLLLLAGCDAAEPEPEPTRAELAGLDADHACPRPDFAATLPTTVEEVLYDVENGEELYADLVLPDAPGPHPGVVMVHGGGWTSGNRGYFGAAAADYAAAGFAVLNIEYRLIPGVKHPAQVRDLQCAVRWLRSHADVDDQCVGILGASAGGHLSALAALGAGDPLFGNGCEQAEDVEPTTRFAMPYYGIFDPVRFGETEGLTIVMEGWAGEGVTLQDLSAVERAGDRVAVPIFLAHGTADDLVPDEQSVLFEQALAAHDGRDVQLELVDGAPHGFVEGPYLDVHNQAVQPAAEAFVLRALEPIGE
jgi:acetyl esterase/lipase